MRHAPRPEPPLAGDAVPGMRTAALAPRLSRDRGRSRSVAASQHPSTTRVGTAGRPGLVRRWRRRRSRWRRDWQSRSAEAGRHVRGTKLVVDPNRRSDRRAGCRAGTPQHRCTGARIRPFGRGSAAASLSPDSRTDQIAASTAWSRRGPTCCTWEFRRPWTCRTDPTGESSDTWRWRRSPCSRFSSRSRDRWA